MTTETDVASTGSLATVLAAGGSRIDQWSQLNAVARAWATAGAGSARSGKLRGDAASQFAALARVEHCWAYPGRRLLAAVGEALEGGDAAVFARLVQKVSRALLSGDFRRDEAAWDAGAQSDSRVLDLAPPDRDSGAAQKPYFEVLIVTPTEPSAWENSAEEIRRLRRVEDAFHYETVHVGSLEDAVLAVMLNDGLQAVVLMDGFQLASRHDMPDLKEFLARHVTFDTSNLEPGRMATALAKGIKNYRPELDLYLMSDRTAESIAGSDEVAPIRRMFHHVEEPMEIHLSILDGIKDRYETPYFDNLKKYAQRPIGTFHALPIARGKSVFRSNWIRDMGQFYGANIFFAESSRHDRRPRQPARADRQHQEGPGGRRARLRREARLPRDQRHLDLQQDRGAGGVQAGRHRHRGPQLPQVAPLRLRALGRAALLRRGLPADPVLDVRRGAAQDDQEGAVRLRGRGQARPRQGHRPDELHLRRPHVQPAARDGGVPRDQAGPRVPVGRGLVRVRALQPLPPAPVRPRRGRRAERALQERGVPGRVRGLEEEAPEDRPEGSQARSRCRCCPTRTRCASASTRRTRRTSRCRRSGRAR